MENKEFISELSRRLERSSDDIGALADGFSALLKEKCGALDTIAIPGFGKFVGEKLMERIETDPGTGKRVLLPPEIRVAFEPSTILKARIAEKGAENGR